MTIEETVRQTTHRFDRRSESDLNDLIRGIRTQGIKCIGCKKVINKKSILTKCTNQ
jgi:hypothetical protein